MKKSRRYIAFFNRPADAEGIEYWSSRMEKGVTLGQIASSFVHSPEFKALYAGSSNAEVITSVYRNLFGRTPDDEGLAYWEGVLDRGQIDAGMLAFEVLMGAGPVDRVIVNNKTNAAVAFTSQLPKSSGMYDGAALSEARDWLRNIDEKPLSDEDIKKQVEKMFGTGTDNKDNDNNTVVSVDPAPIKYTFELGYNGLFDPTYIRKFTISGFNAHEDGIRIVANGLGTYVKPDVIHSSSFGKIGGADSEHTAVFFALHNRGDGTPLQGNETVVFSYIDDTDTRKTYIFIDDGRGLGANGPNSASWNLDSDLIIDITGYEKLDIVGSRVENLFFYD